MSADHVASHYNAVPNTCIQERTNSRIYHLRNFNNWIKSMLIGEFLKRLNDEGCPSATVLDLCCGKGGDLLKWKIGNIKKIVMTDVAKVALDHCQNRYNELFERFKWERKRPFDAYFVAADSTKENLASLFPQPDMQFDICSCQFALHYSFSSEESARRLLWNATQSLRVGGYFIGTVPNANMIVHFLRKSNENGFFKNDVCQIKYADKSRTFDDDYQPPLFGAQLNFSLCEVVDCPEYLAYFPLVVKILEEFGMKLIYKNSFPDATKKYLEEKEHESKSLLLRMKALEAFPAPPNVSLIADAVEYEHADLKLKSLNVQNSNQRIGTLSKSEWDVTSMYLAFAFVKQPL